MLNADQSTPSFLISLELSLESALAMVHSLFTNLPSWSRAHPYR